MANNDAAINSNTGAISSIDSSIVSLSGDVTNNILDVTNLKVCSVLHSKYFTFLVWEVRESKHVHTIFPPSNEFKNLSFIKNRLMLLLMLLRSRKIHWS